MKQIVSVSLGSSKRNHEAKVNCLGEDFTVKRIGTDGDFKAAVNMLTELDGKVDAIGLGGVDVYLYSPEGERYALKDGLKLMDAVKKTPVVDGSGLKNTLEREVIKYIVNNNIIDLKGKTVLMVSAMDRFGMAQSLLSAGCDMIYGDLIFALGLDKPLYEVDELISYAKKLLPDITKLPISMLYPTGKKQDSNPDPKFTKYYDRADIIAGDFHFIKKYMPDDLENKIIITNTVTEEDIEQLKKRNLSLLITTTPEFGGRSFGTNVLEALLLAILNKKWEDITDKDYLELIQKLGLKPRIEKLTEST
ncbi:MAG: quinate 5-dehydrogenase [Armatimonadota bacterium]